MSILTNLVDGSVSKFSGTRSALPHGITSAIFHEILLPRFTECRNPDICETDLGLANQGLEPEDCDWLLVYT